VCADVALVEKHHRGEAGGRALAVEDLDVGHQHVGALGSVWAAANSTHAYQCAPCDETAVGWIAAICCTDRAALAISSRSARPSRSTSAKPPADTPRTCHGCRPRQSWPSYPRGSTTSVGWQDRPLSSSIQAGASHRGSWHW
jgi:hypothetical protein